MTYLHTAYGDGESFGFRAVRGDNPRLSVVHKFGHNPAVGTSYVPICIGGVYQMPQTATTVRIKAGGNANDTAAGSGARELMIQGLDATGALVEESLATNGTSASAATSTSFLRIFRVFVSASGTYATAAGGSHADDIVIEDSAGANDWLTIASTGFSAAQSEIGFYTVPLGYTAYVQGIVITTETNKTCDVLIVQRRNILESAAPYSAMREVTRLVGLDGRASTNIAVPHKFPALTDIGFVGETSTGTSAISVSFEIFLEADAV